MGYKRNVSSNIINQIIKISFGFLISILIARALGPEKQGYIAYILLVLGIIASYAPLGINNATVYFQKRDGISEQNLFQTNTTYLFLNFLIITIILLILYSFKLFMSDYPVFYLFGAIIYIFSSYLVSNHNLFFLGNENIVESNKYAIQAFFTKAVIITLLYILAYLNAYTYFAITVLALLLNAILLNRKLSFTFHFQMDWKLLKQEFSYGLIVYFSSLFIFLNYRIDQILIKYMKGNADLGVYTIAVTLAELLFVIPTGISSALTARLVNCKDELIKRKTTSQTIKFSFYVCMVLCFVGMAGSFLVPYVYGAAYKKAILSTIILLVGIIFASLGRVSFPYFFASGKAFFHLVITFITLLLNLGLNFVFIPKYGIHGAALASSISYCIYGIYYIVLFVVKEKFTFRDFFCFEKNEIKQFISIIKNYHPRSNNDN